MTTPLKLGIVGHSYFVGNKRVETYYHSMVRAFNEAGCVAVDHTPGKITKEDVNWADIILEVDCGRTRQGYQSFLGRDLFEPFRNTSKTLRAVYFIDSHGQPSLHKRLSPQYDIVFYAVHDKRSLFQNHSNAVWLPNFTDATWFNPRLLDKEPSYDFGFYGSKHGLARANPLIDICRKRNWSCDVRQISNQFKHRWPQTAEAMLNCRVLFNHGQKHDGPNLRVVESMACKRPLITDVDPRSGMNRLFTEGVDYIGYESLTYKGLENAMEQLMESPELRSTVATNGYNNVTQKHLVEHRVRTIIETIGEYNGK